MKFDFHGLLTDRRRAAVWALAFACALAALYIVWDSIGLVVRTYSALPYWDQWDTILDYQALRHGNYSLELLFNQHNEHRLALPRLGFFADYALARGTNWLDLVVITAIQLIHAALLISLLKPRRDEPSAWIVAAAAVGLLMSIGQWENLTWGFQTQFVGVFALATGAFMMLGRAVTQGRSRRALLSFLGVLFLLLLATFSMANGMVAFAIAIALALVLRAPWWMTVALAATLAAVGLIYFHGYHSVPANSPPAYAIAHPFEFIRYCLSYLGNPIGERSLYHPWPSPGAPVPVAPTVLGVLGALLAAAAILQVLLRRGADRTQAVLTAIMLFVLATAAVTTLGRLNQGVDQAYSSRYRTPVCIFWAAQLIFWFRSAAPRPAWAKAVAAGAPVVVLLVLLVVQHVVKPEVIDKGVRIHQAENALLAGVADLEAVKMAYPTSNELFERVGILREYNKSIFTQPRAHWMGRRLSKVAAISKDRCLGAFDLVTRSPFGEIDAVRAVGWAWDRKGWRPPRHILLTDDSLRIVGFGVSGAARPDVRRALKIPTTDQSGWEGVARARSGVLHAFALLSDDTACEIGVHPTAPLPPAMTTWALADTDVSAAILSPVKRERSWTVGGASPTTGPPPADATGYASWSGRDENRGVIAFGPFRATGPALALKLITGPDVSGQSVLLRDAKTGEVLAALEPGKLAAWTWLRLELPPSAAGRTLLLQGIDQGARWGQWMGMSGPHAVAADPAPRV